jgi:hypothetical protein
MTTYMTADQSRHRRVDPPPTSRLPLHAELYLLAHHDDTGEPHVSERSLAIGLAAAILLELAMSRHVAVGWVFNHLDGTWRKEPGRLTRTTFESVPDPLTDAALAAIDRTAGLGSLQLREFLRTHAASGLYERVQAHLITVGLLQRVSRRRLAGLVKADRTLAVSSAFTVRARARVRYAVAFDQGRGRYPDDEADDQCAALCGLVAVLELAEFDLLSNMSARQYTEQLHSVVARHGEPTIGDVVAAVDAGRGDLAVAAMR